MKTAITLFFSLVFLLAAGAPAHAQETEWKALNAEVETLYRLGQYDRAVQTAKQALEVAKKNDDPDNPLVATSLNNLASLYSALGQYTLAEPILKRVLAITEEALGPDHPNVATSLNNLGTLYEVLGEYALAEPLQARPRNLDKSAQPQPSLHGFGPEKHGQTLQKDRQGNGG